MNAGRVSRIRQVLDDARAVLSEHPDLGRSATLVRATLGEATSVEVKAGGYVFRADEPEVAGGHGLAPNPVQYALGALAACTAITYRYWSEILSIPIDSVEVRVRGDGDVRGILGLDDIQPTPAVSMTVQVTGPATSSSYMRLHEQVEAHCPVLAMFRTLSDLSSALEVVTTEGGVSPGSAIGRSRGDRGDRNGDDRGSRPG